MKVTARQEHEDCAGQYISSHCFRGWKSKLYLLVSTQVPIHGHRLFFTLSCHRSRSHVSISLQLGCFGCQLKITKLPDLSKAFALPDSYRIFCNEAPLETYQEDEFPSCDKSLESITDSYLRLQPHPQNFKGPKGVYKFPPALPVKGGCRANID